MGKLFLIAATLLCPIMLMGCALGAATSAYSVNSKSADELSATCRKSIVDEAVQKAKEYCDQVCEKKK